MAFFGWLFPILWLPVLFVEVPTHGIRNVTDELESSVENLSVDVGPYLVENWTRFCLHGPNAAPYWEYPIRSVRKEDMNTAGDGTQFISSISETDDRVVIVNTRFVWLAGEYERSCFDRGRSTVFPIGERGTELIYADED
jgi:hypothetical protein